MSGLFIPTLMLHVVVAVLGLGSMLSVALVARMARRSGRDPAEAFPWLDPLLRLASLSLGTMLVTGIILNLSARGAFHEYWWFRVSAVLVLAVGAFHGAARRTVRSGLRKPADSGALLQRVERLAYAMCAGVASIAALMEAKPF